MANDAATGSLPVHECCELVPARNVAVPATLEVRLTRRIVCAARSSPLTATPRGTPAKAMGSMGFEEALLILNFARRENAASTPQKSCRLGSSATSIQFFWLSPSEPALNVSATAFAELSRLMFRLSAMSIPPTIGVGKGAAGVERHSACGSVAHRASTGASRRRPHAVPGFGSVGDSVVAVAEFVAIFAFATVLTVRPPET